MLQIKNYLLHLLFLAENDILSGMRKIIYLLLFFLISLPCFGDEGVSVLNIGINQQEILNKFGAADLVSVNSDNNEVWVYENVNPVMNYNNSGFGFYQGRFGASPYYTDNPQKPKNKVLIIVFDDNKNIKEYTYQINN